MPCPVQDKSNPIDSDSPPLSPPTKAANSMSTYSASMYLNPSLLQAGSTTKTVLVKLVRSHDATSIIRNRKNLASMPIGMQSRICATKERKSLINSGVDRCDIKIRGRSLLV